MQALYSSGRFILLTWLLILFAMRASWAQKIDPDYVDGQLYVKVAHTSDQRLLGVEAILNDRDLAALAAILQQYEVTSIDQPFAMLRTPVFDRTYRFHFKRMAEAEALIGELEKIAWIEYAERVPMVYRGAIPNDPSWSSQDQYYENLVDAHLAWDLETGGDVVIAIVDDAVQISHPDLAPNVWVNPGEVPGNGIDDDGNGFVDDIHGYDIGNNDNDPNPPVTASSFNFSHGTHCAGIAAAATNNGIGIAGMGYHNKIMAVKCNSDTVTSPAIYDAYQAVGYAIAAHADIISMSWGGSAFSMTNQNVMTQAHNQGILLVAAAGNHGTSNIMYPAGYTHVIAVANTTNNDTKANSSAYGSWIDVSAPGTDIFSTVAPSAYVNYTGTSMACPMVAGLLSLMKSHQPNASLAELEAYLLAGAENIDDVNSIYAFELGPGRINAHHALLAMEYCLSYATNQPDSRIDEVVFAGINNHTTHVCETYSIFPQDIGYLDPGTSMPISLTLGSCDLYYGKGAKVYIDWNRDGDFSDAGEEVYATPSVASAPTTYNGSIAVPASLSPTDTFRMRVVCQEVTSVSDISPCGPYAYGETEDYLLTRAPGAATWCSGTLIANFPYTADFESFPTCPTTSGSACNLPVGSGWANESGDDLDWTVHAGGTPSTGTGPATDSVPGTPAGKYLYVEATTSGNYPGREAWLTSPCFDLTGLSHPTLGFAYHMLGSGMGTLHVEINNGSGWQSLWSLSGDQGDAWRAGTVSLDSYLGDTVKVRFRGVTGADFTSDLAIDYVRVFSNPTTQPPACSGLTTLTAPSGTFGDGSGPGANYGNNSNCTWLIAPANATSVTLTINSFDTEVGNDVVNVYDGNSSAAPLLASYDGQGVTGSVSSTGGELFVEFITDGSGVDAGWEMSYNATINTHVLTYLADHVGGAAGSTVSLPVRMTNFTDVVSFQGSMHLSDPSVAQFVSGSVGGFNANLGGISAANFNVTNHTVTFSWNDPALNPTNIPDNEVIFTIDVQLVGNMGDITPVYFDDTPTLREAVVFTGGNFLSQTPDTVGGSIELLNEVSLSGLVRTENLDPLNQVNIDLNGTTTATTTTPTSGLYSFSGQAAGGSYTLTPSKDLDPSNGVTTFDIVFVRQHVLGSSPLNSPYKIIAADVNGDNNVTTFDIIFMRQVILAVANSFPNGVPSWRFVPVSHTFADPTNPFSPQYPQSLTLANQLVDATNLDFVAIKMGDVNQSASNLRLSTPDDELTLRLLDQSLTAGEVVEVPIRAQDFEHIVGYQFSVGFDTEVLKFKSWEPVGLESLGEGNFNLEQVQQGIIPTSWDDPQGQGVDLDAETPLFVLRFEVLETKERLSEVFHVGSTPTLAEAYNSHLQQLNLRTRFVEAIEPADGFYLFQNQPNPFQGQTQIGYRLPQAAPVTLTVSDQMGRVVEVMQMEGQAGYNVFKLPATHRWAAGVYHYRLDTPGFSATRPMWLAH